MSLIKSISKIFKMTALLLVVMVPLFLLSYYLGVGFFISTWFIWLTLAALFIVFLVVAFLACFKFWIYLRGNIKIF